MTAPPKPARKRPIVCVTLDADLVRFLKERAKAKRSGGISGVVTDALLAYPPFVEFCRKNGYSLPSEAEVPAPDPAPAPKRRNSAHSH